MINTTTQPEELIPESTPPNFTKAVLKGLAIIAILPLAGMQVFAFTQDSTLINLERDMQSNIASYQKNVSSALSYIEATQDKAEDVCSSYMALKAYKEAKEYTIQDPTFNPCQTMIGFKSFKTTETSSPQQPEQKHEEQINS